MCVATTLAAMGAAIGKAFSAVGAAASSAGAMKIAAGVQAASSLGSALVGYQGAKAQAEMQNYMYEQNKLNAQAAMRQGYLTIQQRQQQEMAAAADDIQARRLEAMQQTATANVAAGEAGVSGFSVERVLRDIGAVASRDISAIQQNRDWNVNQLNNEMLGLGAQTKSRILSVPKAMKPNVLPYILQGVGGAAQAYATYKTGQTRGK